jgi:hypothetical protein
MATITKLEQQFKEGKPSGYKVNLSDGTFGYLVEKESDKGLVEGDEVTYTAETPTGKTYKKLTVKKAGQVAQTQAPAQQSASAPLKVPSTAPVSATKSLSEMKFEGRVVCMKLGVECLIAGKLERHEVKEAFAEWVSVMDASIDDIKPSR